MYASRVHPAADLFPMMSGAAFDALVEDIRVNGLAEPIVLLDGDVLDGRNRLKACKQLQIPPKYERITEDDVSDPYTFVVSRNLRRRHLNESQRALVGARLLQLHDAGKFAHGRKRDVVAGWVSVSSRSVGAADAVLQSGSPELVAAVEDGTVAVSAARNLATLPADEQRKVIATADPKVLKTVAKDIRDKRRAKTRETRDAKRAAAAAASVATLPELDGIDLRNCDVEVLVGNRGPSNSYSGTRGELYGAGVCLVHSDAPWIYNQGGNGAASAHYEGRTVKQIANDLNNAYDCAADDAILLCWVTGPILWEFTQELVLRAHEWWQWGRYRSIAAWHKSSGLGTGHYWRGDAEFLLLFIKGAPVIHATISNAMACPRTAHSEKPEKFARAHLRAFTAPGAVVLDLYAGRGSMARACRQEQRRYVGAELDALRHSEALASFAA